MFFYECCGVRVEIIMVDVLHCVELRIASHIVGNIFWILWKGSTILMAWDVLQSAWQD